MDWQTSITLVILAIAAGILFRRLGAFLHASRAGKCGSCVGCGDSAKDKAGLQLVPLRAAAKSEGIADHLRRSTEAGVEKTRGREIAARLMFNARRNGGFV